MTESGNDYYKKKYKKYKRKYSAIKDGLNSIELDKINNNLRDKMKESEVDILVIINDIENYIKILKTMKINNPNTKKGVINLMSIISDFCDIKYNERPIPEYELRREEGADHAKKFYVICRIPDDGTEIEASGASRRKAEQAAATRVLLQLQENAGK